MMNRRGEDTGIFSNAGTIVLVVAVVVLLLVGGVKLFGWIFDKADVLPGQGLETKVQACKIAAKPAISGVADYCFTFTPVEISGVKRYVNCEYKPVKDALVLEKVEPSFTCPANMADKVKEECKTLIANNIADKNTRVNDDICSGYTCKELTTVDSFDSTKTTTCPSGKKLVKADSGLFKAATPAIANEACCF